MGCVDPNRATEVRLNASTPFKPDALFLSVTTVLISAFIFKALVDPSSTHCFVDPRFIATHKLITYSVPPIQLNSSMAPVITLSLKPLIFRYKSPPDMSLRLHFM